VPDLSPDESQILADPEGYEFCILAHERPTFTPIG